MIRTARRTAAIAIALALLGACASERAAPVATRPPRSTTTTTTTRTTDDDGGRSDGSGPDDTDGSTVTDGTDGDPTTDGTDVATSEPDPTTTLPPGGVSPEAWAAFDEALSDRLIGGGDYAAGVAVAVHGRIVHTADFGYRVPPPAAPDPVDPASTMPSDASTSTSTTLVDAADPIEPGDRFRIASISKVITATVVLQLVEAGQIQLDTPIGDDLAALVGATISDPNMASITVRQLLSHTAGFPSYQGTFFGGRVESCPAVAQQGLSALLAAPPGTTYRYSNLNFCLLGLLIEQVAGRPYESVVNDRLLEPLGIEGMRMVKTFDPDPSEVVHPSAPARNYMEVLGAAGSWVATPSDIVTIVDSLDPTTPGWHPLSPPMMDLMRQPVPAIPYPNAGRWYGLGLMGFADGSFGHTGTVEMTHAMVLDRPDGVTWSVLVSGENPGETSNLQGIVDRSLADAGISFS